MMFQGEPFAEEDYCLAIEEVKRGDQEIRSVGNRIQVG